MSERRAYCCLMCSDRPVFHSRLGALMHAREEHVALLAEHHVDELFQVSAQEYVEPSDNNVQPPFQCRHCEQKPVQLDTAEQHVKNYHQIGEPVYGRDYISQYDLMLEQERKKAEEEAAVERFATVVGTLRGVSDFLVECRA